MPGRKFFIVTLVTLLTLGAASPAFADCCDSIIDCAATVATDGVSCAIQEFIDSIKDLASFVQNLLDQASGATSSATRGAEAAVTGTINDMTAETNQNAEALRASEAQGAQLASNEAQFKILSAKTVGNVPVAGVTLKPAAPPATTRPIAARKVAQAPPPPPANPMHGTLINPNAAPVHLAAPKPAPTPTMTAPLAAAGPTTVPLAAPARAFLDEMNRASAELSKEKAAGDQNAASVMRFMAQARQSEGSGMKSANQIADAAVEAPFKNMLNQLTSLLTNPGDLTSPKSAIEAMANSIMGNLNVSIDRVIDAITSGPNQAFQDAQPAYTQLQAHAERARAIANAMDVLYRDRSQAAANALEKLLPKVAAVATENKYAPFSSNLARHLAYPAAMAKFATSKQQVKATFMKRFDGLSTRMTKYEGVRAKARNNRSSVVTYRTNFSAKLDASMRGKTPAQITAMRDSLVAVARTKYANDPKTRDAVINLLSSESAKRASIAKR
ncbi:MAG: hypothetical protein M3Y05_13460 [Gemmatimonadota bacterium]|nr:hypothetical protein [Gemmatimonadota bacterium]